jgi:hypothetical protein
MIFELFFDDLTPTAQAEILEKAGIKSADEMNWEVFPITTIEFENEGD